MDNSPFLYLRKGTPLSPQKPSIPFPGIANCIPGIANCIPKKHLLFWECSSTPCKLESEKKAAKVGTQSEIIAERRGQPVYLTNPSIPAEGSISRPRRRQIGDDHKGLVIDDGSGEILGRGTAVAYEWEEVDSERFVKLFLGGVKQAAGLSKAGLIMFEMVYNALRDRPGADKVELSFLTAGKPKNTFYGGIKELLEKGFLYNSPIDGSFFVNIRYMFNGDRLAFVKAYHLKGAKPDTRQLSLLPPEAG